MDAVEGGVRHVHIGGGLARAGGCQAHGFHQAGQVNARCGEEPVRPLEVSGMGDGAGVEEPPIKKTGDLGAKAWVVWGASPQNKNGWSAAAPQGRVGRGVKFTRPPDKTFVEQDLRLWGSGLGRFWP